MKKNNVNILDCTLRDGGYVIDWEFGKNKIQSITNNLAKSEVDYIECGFLKEIPRNENITFWNTPEELEPFILPEKEYTLMINYGEYNITNFKICNMPNIKIRVAFKKYNQQEALDYIKKLKFLGWDVFANPMNTNTYNQEELFSLIENFNSVNPDCVTIVDTFGNMYENDVKKIFKIFDKNLKKEIAIGFHSHNSLQLSFSNTKTLLNMQLNRNLIIDSCIYGMGRGAGNLCTELITKYLNDNYNKNYKIEPILKSINNDITPFYEQKPWGYSLPYYIAAIHGCHPNYASYLVEQGFSDEKISEIIGNIPEDKKTIFDKIFIESFHDIIKPCLQAL